MTQVISHMYLYRIQSLTLFLSLSFFTVKQQIIHSHFQVQQTVGLLHSLMMQSLLHLQHLPVHYLLMRENNSLNVHVLFVPFGKLLDGFQILLQLEMQGGLGRKLIYRLIETRLGPPAIGSYSIERYTLAISYLPTTRSRRVFKHKDDCTQHIQH